MPQEPNEPQPIQPQSIPPLEFLDIPPQPTPQTAEPQLSQGEPSEAERQRSRVETKPQARRQWAFWRKPGYAPVTGILAANGMGLGVALLLKWLVSGLNDNGGLMIASSFVLIPFAMGVVCAYFWRNANLSIAAYLLYGLLNTGIALLLAFVFMWEGAICLLMASPLLLGFVLGGTLLGREIFKSRHPQLRATLAPLLLALMVGDFLLPHDFHNQETDRIVIRATPQQVWKYIIDYPAIQTPSDYWLCKLGMPAPIQSTASGHRVGDSRRCIFTGNIAFEEKITVVEPAHRLTFDVVTQPNNPEVIGHLVLEKGQFTLQDNHDGTTTVTGTSWYKLNVYPVCYYDLWVQDVVRGVHLRVMRHIKKLAETQGIQQSSAGKLSAWRE